MKNLTAFGMQYTSYLKMLKKETKERNLDILELPIVLLFSFIKRIFGG